jgi:hypothetical protein
MSSHDRTSVQRFCGLSRTRTCTGRPGTPQGDWAAAVAVIEPAGHARVRCRGLRTRPSYLADLGSCMYRYLYSWVTWRVDGPPSRPRT